MTKTMNISKLSQSINTSPISKSTNATKLTHTSSSSRTTTMGATTNVSYTITTSSTTSIILTLGTINTTHKTPVTSSLSFVATHMTTRSLQSSSASVQHFSSFLRRTVTKGEVLYEFFSYGLYKMQVLDIVRYFGRV